MEFQDKVPVFLPPNIDQDAAGPSLEELAKNFFTDAKTGGLFSKKTLSTQEAISFSKEHTNAPLLSSVSKNYVKDALLLQKGILKLTEVRDSKQFKGNIGDLVMMGSLDQCIADEGYVIFIKQSNGSPNPTLVKTMQLLALWAKYHLPSPELHPYILAQMAKLAKRTDFDNEVTAYVQFAYIRVSGRIRSHISHKPTKEQIEESVDDLNNSKLCFGISLEEIMWHQRVEKPKMYVPNVMHKMANTFINIGCLNTEGIFRLPGNATRVESCPEKANKGEDFLKGLDVKDVATLIKLWFRTIEGFIVSEEFARANIYKEHKNTADIIALANQLPFLNKCTLMYLIGFLRRLAAAQATTAMSEANLAMTFAMSISYVPDDEAVTTNQYIHYFLTVLIKEWDVSAIYPLPSSML